MLVILETRDDVERVVRDALDVRNNGWVTNHNHLPFQAQSGYCSSFESFSDTTKFWKCLRDVNQFGGVEGFTIRPGSASKLVYDTDSLILHILQKDKDVLFELLTTNRSVAVYWNGKNDPVQIQRAGGEDKYRSKHHLPEP